MSEFEIRSLKDLRQAKRTLRKRMDRREIIIRTNLAHFQDRWQDDRMGASFPYKNVIVDGFSVLLDAIYVLRAGTKNKTRLLIRFFEIGGQYVSQRYFGQLMGWLRNIFPFGSKKEPDPNEEEGDA